MSKLTGNGRRRSNVIVIVGRRASISQRTNANSSSTSIHLLFMQRIHMLELLRAESPLRGTGLLRLLSKKRNLGGNRRWNFKSGDVFWCGEAKLYNPWVVSAEGAKSVQCKHTSFLWVRHIRDLTSEEMVFGRPRETRVVFAVRIYRLNQQPMASIIKSVWITPGTLWRLMRPRKGFVVQNIANHPDPKLSDSNLRSLYVRLGVMPGNQKIRYDDRIQR